MLMGVTHPVHVNTLTLFYVMNFVIALLVITFGGLVVVTRLQQHKFRLFASDSSSARNVLIVGLGSLWLVDGLLQAQPLMVTQFTGGVLAPLLTGQPALVAAVVRLGMRLWRLHPLVWNLVAIWMQIGIGAVILLGGETRGRRIGLWTSIGWGLLVWGPGEGFGSIFSGGSWLLGSPGSVLFYVLAAGVLLLPSAWWRSPRFLRVWQEMIAGLWALAALLQTWPANGWWSSHRFSAFLTNQARMPQPSLFSAPLYAGAQAVAQSAIPWNAGIVGIFLILALLWILGRPARLTWWLTVGVTGSTWWFGQDFGVLGGMGTDPNSAALVLLGLVVYALIVPLPADRAVTRPTQTD
ncbi:MAG: hypothetical protein M1499_08250 [Firmicutes bacterium]|nr:hypothetical protein [Bacillota bacterium]